MVTSQQKPTGPAASHNAKPKQSAVLTTPPVTPVHPTPSPQQQTATAPQPSEGEIRDYANHLYTQRGSVNGHDGDDWLEAEACLRANIPKESSRTRMPITHRSRIAPRSHW